MVTLISLCDRVRVWRLLCCYGNAVFSVTGCECGGCGPRVSGKDVGHAEADRQVMETLKKKNVVIWKTSANIAQPYSLAVTALLT